jgi:hypothetical protein
MHTKRQLGCVLATVSCNHKVVFCDVETLRTETCCAQSMRAIAHSKNALRAVAHSKKMLETNQLRHRDGTCGCLGMSAGLLQQVTHVM